MSRVSDLHRGEEEGPEKGRESRDGPYSNAGNQIQGHILPLQRCAVKALAPNLFAVEQEMIVSMQVQQANAALFHKILAVVPLALPLRISVQVT